MLTLDRSLSKTGDWASRIYRILVVTAGLLGALKTIDDVLRHFRDRLGSMDSPPPPNDDKRNSDDDDNPKSRLIIIG